MWLTVAFIGSYSVRGPLILGRGGGQVVSVLTSYSDNPSSNPAEAYSFFCFKGTKINKKRPGIEHLKIQESFPIRLILHQSDWLTVVTWPHKMAMIGRRHLIVYKLQCCRCAPSTCWSPWPPRGSSLSATPTPITTWVQSTLTGKWCSHHWYNKMPVNAEVISAFI